MKLPCEVRFVDEKIKKVYEKLEAGDSSEQQLFKCITEALERIEANAFCGIQIPKKLIPKEYVKKHGLGNLWKYNLPNSWRLIYSIRGSEAIVVSIILEWMTHKDYNRRFKYS